VAFAGRVRIYNAIVNSIIALHRTAQRSLPVVLVGAGLPQLPGQMGRATSYAERLFDFPLVGPLPREAPRIAIAKPASDQGVKVTQDASRRIFQETHGYPYFLQEWGKHAWDTAQRSPITLRDVESASVTGRGSAG
jgi:hypothetical protein